MGVEKKKAVITILGKARKIEKEERAKYYFEESLNNKYTLHKENYTNMFPLLIDNFKELGFDIVPIFTKEARDTNMEVLKDEGIEFDNFNNDFYIEKDAEYYTILKLINKALSNYDEVIFDVSHGFRHLPILATISLITQNIRQSNKIQEILFTKVIKDRDEYEIVSLLEYLDLANLSFVLTNFKDNYTVSKHIQIKQKKYQELINSMNKFSSDIMSLSLENLLDNTSRKLTESIDNILLDDTTILKNELKELRRHIVTTFSKRDHRYETYYYLSIDLSKINEEKQRGYLVHSLALIFEAIGFYLKSSFSHYDKSLKEYIDKEEHKIQTNNKFDYYKLVDGCRSFLFFDKDRNNNSFFDEGKRNLIYKKLDSIENISDFKSYASKVKKLRNNLLHANSGNSLNNTENDISTILEEFNRYCIDGDILQTVNVIPKHEDKIKKINSNTEKKLLNNVKKIRKVKPTGIDASQDEVINLADKFNNR